MKNYGNNCSAIAAIAGAALLVVGTAAFADDHDEDEDELEFDETEIFFELNDTDGDLGIHALIDGDGWKRLTMVGPDGNRMLHVRVKSNLRRQGLTEFFFESAEPTFDEVAPQTFFARFPAGEYEVEGETIDGREIEGETLVSHAMPSPPQPTVNGYGFDTDCDDEDFVKVTEPVMIAWPPVTMSHPEAEGAGAGVQPPVPVDIHNYQVVVEAELEMGDGSEFASVFSIILPPDTLTVTVPPEILALSDEFKYEVLAREASYNQTAVESCFALE